MVEPAMSVGPAVLNNPENPTLSAAPKDRRQYTCLCGCMHLRTATLIIGALETLALVVSFISVVVRYSNGTEKVGSLVGVIISSIIIAVAVVCLFLAVRRQYPLLLLPHIAIQILGIIGLLIFVIVRSATAISSALHKNDIDPYGDTLGTDIGLLVVALIATGINTWFVVVVAKYYHFLRGHL